MNKKFGNICKKILDNFEEKNPITQSDGGYVYPGSDMFKSKIDAAIARDQDAMLYLEKLIKGL